MEMSPIGLSHPGCVNFLNERLVLRLQGRFVVSVQNPVRLDNRSELQPDIALIDRSRAQPRRDAPGATNVIVIIEVSDSTASYDRNVKMPLYASAGIPEAWIIDLQGEAIERYSEPVERSYRLAARAGRGMELTSLVLPHLLFSVDNVLEG